LSHCVTVRDVRGSIPGRDVDNFQVTYSFCPHSVALESAQKSVGKVRPSPGANNSAVLLVWTVRIRTVVQNFISLLSLHDFLGGGGEFLKYNNHNDRITQ
jgi:hypothetical protein